MRAWCGVFGLVLFLLAAALPAVAQVTTPPTTGAGMMSNFLESIIANSAEASGGALVPVTDAAVGSALTAEAGAAASALSLSAGAVMTAAGLGFGLGAGAACLTVAKDICGNPIGSSLGGPWQWTGLLGTSTPTTYSIPAGTAIYRCSGGKTWYYSTDPQAAINACAKEEFPSAASVNCTVNSNKSGGSCVETSTTGAQTTVVGPSLFQVTTEIPSGGLQCNNTLFNTPGLVSALDCSEIVPVSGSDPGSKNPAAITVNDVPPLSLSEPADPDLIATIANNLNRQMAGTSNGGSNSDNPSQPAPVSHTITGSMVSQVEQQTGITPRLSDLLAPLGPGSQVVVSNGQTSVSSVTQPTNQSLTSGSGLPVPASQQNQGTPCGNLLAGEPACVETIDMTFNPETGCYEYMGATALARTTDDCSNNPGKNKDSANIGPLQDLTTQILKQVVKPDSASKTVTTATTTVDTLTSPEVAVQTATKTQDATLTKTGEQLTNKYPPPSTPVITLPFDEWPQVFQSFNTSVPNFSGQCPTVSFSVGVLRNTTFTFATQCLVMDSLKPYMQYVLPPTYLLMGLLFLMAA